MLLGVLLSVKVCASKVRNSDFVVCGPDPVLFCGYDFSFNFHRFCETLQIGYFVSVPRRLELSISWPGVPYYAVSGVSEFQRHR